MSIRHFYLHLGIVFLIIFGLVKAGGITDVLRVSNNSGRLSVFNMSLDPTERATFWSSFLPFFVSKYLNKNE